MARKKRPEKEPEFVFYSINFKTGNGTVVGTNFGDLYEAAKGLRANAGTVSREDGYLAVELNNAQDTWEDS